MSNNDDIFGEIIYSYTRENAIEDGVLIDVTERAKEAGFRYNTCVTSAVWAMIDPSQELAAKTGCDTQGRLWDVLFMARLAMKKALPGQTRVSFELILPQTVREGGTPAEIKTLDVHIGPGDTAEPVITFMVPGED